MTLWYHLHEDLPPDAMTVIKPISHEYDPAETAQELERWTQGLNRRRARVYNAQCVSFISPKHDCTNLRWLMKTSCQHTYILILPFPFLLPSPPCSSSPRISPNLYLTKNSESTIPAGHVCPPHPSLRSW